MQPSLKRGVPFFARYWPTGLGAALQLPSGAHWLIAALDWRGRYDAFIEYLHDDGGRRAVMAAILSPPIWFYPLAFISGVALIYWDFRRKRQPDTRTANDKPQPIRIHRSILEATNKSCIDASGAVIPGDLPFTFAHADGESSVVMQNAIVTDKGGGVWSVTPGRLPPLSFSDLSPEFANLTTSELASQLKATIESLNAMKTQFISEVVRTEPSARTQEWMAERIAAYRERYSTYFSDTVYNLAAAAIRNIGKIEAHSLSKDAMMGAQIVHRRFPVNPMNAGITAFLEEIRNKLH